MSIVKAAALSQEAKKKQGGGIAGWTREHPYLAAGIALTGGIAAADAGVRAIFRKPGQTVGAAVKEGLKEGGLYGGILSTVEPAILHGGLKKKPE